MPDASKLLAVSLVVALPVPYLCGTRHADKPPGWRPDRPSEDGGAIVSRMLRRLQRHKATPGTFFSEYYEAMGAMAAAQDALLPATLKSTSTVIDDSTASTLERATRALEWQQAQVQVLEQLPEGEVLSWPAENRSLALTQLKIVDADYQLADLPAKLEVATLKDYIKLLHVFQFTFDSMPDVRHILNSFALPCIFGQQGQLPLTHRVLALLGVPQDQEAIDITMKRNADLGYPPPSAVPPHPQAPDTSLHDDDSIPLHELIPGYSREGEPKPVRKRKSRRPTGKDEI
jgi:hypothetical protein